MSQHRLGRYQKALYKWLKSHIFYVTKDYLLIIGIIGTFYLIKREIPSFQEVTLWLCSFLAAKLIQVTVNTFLKNKAFSVNYNKNLEKVAIYGAGVSGSKLIQTLQQDADYNIVAFVDDNPELHNHVIKGVTVYSYQKFVEICQEKGVNTVILAMPSLIGARKQEIIENLQFLGLKVKTVPSFNQLLSGNTSIKEIQDISLSNLLGREETIIDTDLDILGLTITGRCVLVTGAGGSIGAELCRQIAKLSPKCLILYEISEYALYQIDLELGETYPEIKRLACLGNILDENYLKSLLNTYQVDIIYHAAAYKHVPLVEENPCQGVYINVKGTLTLAKCAIEANIANFVLISTDKAVRPTSVMGASKRVAELVIQGLTEYFDSITRFAIVRFGNVLNSSGSVIPRFREQIAYNKSITVTHPEMTRYFMSIPEAVRLVMQAGAMAKGGEIFLLDMGKPIRIYDLALQMIRLSGLEPNIDIKIEFTGLRPGEKLHEELLLDGDSIQTTPHPKIYCVTEVKLPWSVLEIKLEKLLKAAQNYDTLTLITSLKQLVPEYSPQDLQVKQ